MKKLLAGVVTAALSVTLFAIPASAGMDDEPTITDIVAASGGEFDNDRRDFDVLYNLVVAADLGETLATPDLGVTVFAPNDRAFVRLARDLGWKGNNEGKAFEFLVAALTDLGGGDPIPLLTDVLLYHVAPGEMGIYQIRNMDAIDTLLVVDGDAAQVFPRPNWKLADGNTDLRNPRFVKPVNVEASNGMIQTINRVLIPGPLG